MNSLVLFAVSAGIGLGLLAAAGTYLANLCNQLVTASQMALNGFSQMEVQLKRRHDLILDLVEQTRRALVDGGVPAHGGPLVHEPSLLESVIQAHRQATENLRNTGPTATDLQAIADAEATLGDSLGRFLIALEDYPELKANETVANLLEKLTRTENRISFARQLFNDFVLQFNRIRNQFPTAILSSRLGYREDMSPLRYGNVVPIQVTPHRDLVGV